MVTLKSFVKKFPKKDAAAYVIGVKPPMLYRWLSGQHFPFQKRILDRFFELGIDPGSDKSRLMQARSEVKRLKLLVAQLEYANGQYKRMFKDVPR